MHTPHPTCTHTHVRTRLRQMYKYRTHDEESAHGLVRARGLALMPSDCLRRLPRCHYYQTDAINLYTHKPQRTIMYKLPLVLILVSFIIQIAPLVKSCSSGCAPLALLFTRSSSHSPHPLRSPTVHALVVAAPCDSMVRGNPILLICHIDRLPRKAPAARRSSTVRSQPLCAAF